MDALETLPIVPVDEALLLRCAWACFRKEPAMDDVQRDFSRMVISEAQVQPIGCGRSLQEAAPPGSGASSDAPSPLSGGSPNAPFGSKCFVPGSSVPRPRRLGQLALQVGMLHLCPASQDASPSLQPRGEKEKGGGQAWHG